MNKLKEKFGKYFQFKNTINGTDYFLRGLALLLFIIPIGILIGVGIGILGADGNPLLAGILVLLGALLLSLIHTDAADERSSVDLGGRRIFKKKTKKKKYAVVVSR